MSPIAMVGFAALALLVVLWGVVSFSPPGRRRTLLEWLAATCLYVALSMLFLSLVLDAREEGSTTRLVAFGFLLVIFVGGGLVSIFNTARSLGSGGDSVQGNATH